MEKHYALSHNTKLNPTTDIYLSKLYFLQKTNFK